MSTYLVAFVVGEFDFIEQVLKNGVVARVCTPLGKTEQGRFALEVSTSEEKKPRVLLVLSLRLGLGREGLNMNS